MQHFNCFLVVMMFYPQTYPQDLWITGELNGWQYLSYLNVEITLRHGANNK